MDQDAVMSELRARAARLRAEGAVPTGVVEELDRFAADTLRRAAVPPAGDPALLAALREVREQAAVLSSSDAAPAAGFAASVTGALEAAVARITELEGLVFRAERTLERVERLEEESQRHGFRPWYPATAFDAHFRGSFDDVLEGARTTASLLQGCAPVADLGCGRGELLTALAELGIESVGVDADAAHVAQVQSLGHAAVCTDAVAWLRGRADASLGGITLVQVIEHLTPQERLDVFALASRVLRPGGRLVVETVNPLSLYVYTHALYLDPTHTQPVHPYYLQFLAQQAGFTDAALDFRSGVPLADCVDRAALDAPTRAAFDRILQFLEAPQDYVLVATR